MALSHFREKIPRSPPQSLTPPPPQLVKPSLQEANHSLSLLGDTFLGTRLPAVGWESFIALPIQHSAEKWPSKYFRKSTIRSRVLRADLAMKLALPANSSIQPSLPLTTSAPCPMV